MREIIEPPLLERRGVRAFFTTRKIGVDRERILASSGLGRVDIYQPVQEHTDRVIVLRHDNSRRVADAVITRRRNVLVGVSVADCVPVILFDSERHICGVVHAGWRGTAAGILRRTIGAMRDEMYSRPSDIIIAIGPSIRWCCYSVGEDVLRAVMGATGEGEYYERRDGKICLDLPSANRAQAVDMGINEDNIWMSTECTYCYPERFFSYRYARGPTGRQGGFVGMFD
ncbi:MAG: peptidoglycan editing factor PgeF [Nitrospirota bacterium]|nr:MAG: peptidoglycan editing factor PgeF [Nitrospirota bacterium]